MRERRGLRLKGEDSIKICPDKSFVTHSGGELHSDPEGAGVHHLADSHDRGLQDRSDDLGWRHFIRIREIFFYQASLAPPVASVLRRATQTRKTQPAVLFSN